MEKIEKIETTNDLIVVTCLIMKELHDGKITREEAMTQAELVKQVNNQMKINLDIQKFKYKIRNENPDTYELDLMKFNPELKIKDD